MNSKKCFIYLLILSILAIFSFSFSMAKDPNYSICYILSVDESGEVLDLEEYDETSDTTLGENEYIIIIDKSGDNIVISGDKTTITYDSLLDIMDSYNKKENVSGELLASSGDSNDFEENSESGDTYPKSGDAFYNYKGHDDIDGFFKGDISGEVVFEDVEEGRWFKEDVYKAFNLGIINSKTETTFSPKEDVTYKDAGTLINIFDDIYGRKNESGEKLIFIEIEPSFYEQKIIREDLATIIYSYVLTQGFENNPDDKIELSFVDNEEIDFYAKEAINWCVKNQIIRGRSNNKLAPRETCTRAELATILCRLENIITESK